MSQEEKKSETLKEAWKRFLSNYDTSQPMDAWKAIKDYFNLITHPRILMFYPFVFFLIFFYLVLYWS